MPVIQVFLWKGFSEEKIKEVISGITDVFVKMGIPARAVEILINEIPKTHWGIEGKLASESMKDVEPPR
ncbi:MAG: 4-oxalocrotonate tautomerase family protein [Candidatus Thorarchaeota archaeon]